MKALLAFAGALVFSASCLAQTTSDAIETADKERNAAMEKVDLAMIDRTTAATYVFTDPSGRVTAKKELMAAFKSGAIKIVSQVTRDVKVNFYGDVAVETGELTSKANRDGRDTSGTYRFTRVWVKQGATWQTVALQETQLK